MTDNYIKGFPEHVGDIELGYRDIEHFIIDLDAETNMREVQKVELKRTYTEARAKLLDKEFDMTDEKKALFNELGIRTIRKVNEMYAFRNRLLKQELTKMKEGKTFARRIQVQLCIHEQPTEDADAIDACLYKTLFKESPYDWCCFSAYKCEAYVTEESEEMQTDGMEINDEAFAELQEDGINYMAHRLKDTYGLAWKDLERIGEWGIKAEYCY